MYSITALEDSLTGQSAHQCKIDDHASTLSALPPISRDSLMADFSFLKLRPYQNRGYFICVTHSNRYQRTANRCGLCRGGLCISSYPDSGVARQLR